MRDDILSRIVADSKIRLAARIRAVPRAEMERRASTQPPVRPGFADVFRAPGLHVIAELKKASPSRGVIRQTFPYRDLARELAACGAAALSVLTEEGRFLGRPEYLAEVAQVVDLPLLRKDFIYDPYQIYEARALGASAVLLIAALVQDDGQLRELAHCARALGLDVLGEAHDEREVDRLLDSPVTLIGVNARNLRTFETSLDTVSRLISRIPRGRLPIAESGIRTFADLQHLAEAGAVGYLVGETLMRADAPGRALRELRGVTAQLKICGLTRREDVDAAVRAEADYLGFVHVPASPRHVRASEIQALTEHVHRTAASRAQVVCVVQNASLAEVQALIDTVHPAVVQLHGDETPEFAQSLRGAEIWRAVHLQTEADVARAAAFPATRLVADAARGGSGTPCDWRLVAELVRRVEPLGRRVMLAGGLTPGNVREALRVTGAAGADVASGVEVESQPGVKSHSKITTFARSIFQ